jgi:chromosome segregation ATPase
MRKELSGRQLVYEQAYWSEHHKLAQHVVEQNALAVKMEELSKENRYCKQELIPRYDDLLHRQGKEIQKMQQEARSSEAEVLEYKYRLRERTEKHEDTMRSVAALLREKDQAEDREPSAHRLPFRLQPARSCKKPRPGKCHLQGDGDKKE